MSFVVSFRGQFRAYDLPETSQARKVRPGQSSSSSAIVGDKDDREDDEGQEFKDQLKKKRQESETDSHEEEVERPATNKNIQPIKAYQQVEQIHQKHKKSFYARDIMSSPVQTLQESNTLNEGLLFMEKYHYRHIPVLNKDKRIVGIVSDRDLLRAQISSRGHTPLAKLMTPEVLSARAITRVQDLARIMLHEGLDCLPILDDDDLLIGIVTQTNILEYVTRESLL